MDLFTSTLAAAVFVDREEKRAAEWMATQESYRRGLLASFNMPFTPEERREVIRMYRADADLQKRYTMREYLDTLLKKLQRDSKIRAANTIGPELLAKLCAPVEHPFAESYRKYGMQPPVAPQPPTTGNRRGPRKGSAQKKNA